MGGRVRIVVPSALTERTDPQHLRWIIAHELAHVRRRDHLVRWLEWLACVTFWWNPVVWWARRKLREAEEASCDELVLDRLRGPARSYGRALLAVVEILAHPATPPLALATGIGAGAGLERRFRTILSDRRARAVPRWLLAFLLATTAASLVVGVGVAGEGGTDVDPVLRAQRPTEPALATTRGAETGADRRDDAYAMVSAPLASTAKTDRGRRRAARARLPRHWDDVFVGTAGPDAYVGTPGDDLVAGRGGSDDLSGRRGRDLLHGGPDSDVLAGGRADDVVISWRDGVRDAIDCGPGDGDRAVVDPTDVVTDCELVHRRDPAG
jgi:BlaR1 peptidase M56/RTX calcium-binding nonapeptide repeat (4 copies)